MTLKARKAVKRGRHEVIKRDQLLDRYKALKQFFENEWGRIGLDLKRVRQADDVRNILKSVPGIEWCRPFRDQPAKCLIADGSTEVEPDELRQTRKEHHGAEATLSKLWAESHSTHQELENSRTAFKTFFPDLQLMSCTFPLFLVAHFLARELHLEKLAIKAAQIDKAVPLAQKRAEQLREQLLFQEAWYARNQTFKFARNKRYEQTAINFARATAGEWFAEQSDGNCRLMGSFAVRLSETASIWRRAVAPIAELVARAFWSTIRRPDAPIATRLTQNNKRAAKGSPAQSPFARVPSQANICAECGKPIERGSKHCANCSLKHSTALLIAGAKRGRIISHSPQAQAGRKETKRLNDLARSQWSPSTLPSWLTEETYTSQIQPRLVSVTLSQIASAIGVSIPYASDIRKGRRRPHPRHWLKLARLVEASESSERF